MPLCVRLKENVHVNACADKCRWWKPADVGIYVQISVATCLSSLIEKPFLVISHSLNPLKMFLLVRLSQNSINYGHCSPFMMNCELSAEVFVCFSSFKIFIIASNPYKYRPFGTASLCSCLNITLLLRRHWALAMRWGRTASQCEEKLSLLVCFCRR